MSDGFLKSRYPAIFASISREKTLEEYPDLNIDNLKYYSDQYVWFKCDKHGYYKQRIKNAVKSINGCPACIYENRIAKSRKREYLRAKKSKRLLSQQKDYLKDVNIQKTKDFCKDVNLDEISVGSHKKIWFHCNIHGDYEQIIRDHYLKSRGCPICGRITNLNNAHKTRFLHTKNKKKLLKDLRPDIWNELDFEKNKEKYPNIDFDNLFLKSKLRLFWKCPKCGCKFEAAIGDRTRKDIRVRNCPKCSRKLSVPENAIYTLISFLHSDVFSDILIDNKECDIFIESLKLCIEYDGIRWHNTKDKREYDMQKSKYFLNKGYKSIRIIESENPEKFKETKEGIILYYLDVSKGYGTDYYKSLNKALSDIFGNSQVFSAGNIRKVFLNIKNNIK